MSFINRRGALSSRGSGFMNGIWYPPNAGGLYVTGRNNYGQLGLGDNVDRNALTRVGTGTDWKQVSTGQNHTVALKYDGTIWATGLNSQGQLGQGNTTDLNVWTQIGSDTNWVFITAMGIVGSTLAIKSNGTLWACGYYGGTGLAQPAFPGPYIYTTMTQVGTDTNWAFISADGNSAIAVKTNGTLWGVGSNADGKIGLGATTFYTTWTQIGSDTDWQSALVTPQNNSWAQKTNGYIYATGYNINGQLGVGDNVNKNAFTSVTNQQAWKSYSSTLFVGADNKLWYTSLGDNLGRYPPTGGNWPIVNSMTQINYSQYGSDNLAIYHSNYINATVYIKTNSTVYLTGVNVNGILDNGLSLPYTAPYLYDYPTLFTGIRAPISLSSGNASFYILR